MEIIHIRYVLVDIFYKMSLKHRQECIHFRYPILYSHTVCKLTTAFIHSFWETNYAWKTDFRTDKEIDKKKGIDRHVLKIANERTT